MSAWAPRYIVKKAPGVEGEPIPSDEPCIVIRGQDKLALWMIDRYINRYMAFPNYDEQVLIELRAHRQRLREWQSQNRTKIADR